MQTTAPHLDVIQRLRVPLFSTLDANDLALVGALARRVSYAQNQLVFARGDSADQLFIVVAGRLRISVLSPDGRELAFRVVGPGEVVGEIAVLDDGSRKARCWF